MAVTGLGQVTGLQGFVNQEPEAEAFEVHGGPADPKHGHWGEASQPYPWEAYAGSWGPPHGPYGAESGLLGDLPETRTFPAGHLAQDPEGDLTPYRGHAAPFPKGRETSVSPDATSRQLEQSNALHADGLNASARAQRSEAAFAKQDEWVDLWEVGPGHDNLKDVTGDVSVAAGGWGVNDRMSNAFHKQNQFGFQDKHQHRRYAVGPIPGNMMWMKPAGRPLVKSLPGPARPPVGEQSPFTGQDVGDTFTYDTGAILQNSPSEYVAPPTAYVAPAIIADTGDAAPVIELW